MINGLLLKYFGYLKIGPVNKVSKSVKSVNRSSLNSTKLKVSNKLKGGQESFTVNNQDQKDHLFWIIDSDIHEFWKG